MSRGENEVLHMKWRVLQITAFKRLNHLSNRNEQVLKMNFKLLLKSIFVQNQSWRFSQDNSRVQSFSSYHTKMGENVDFRSVYDIFKCIQVSIFIFQTSVQMKKCLKQKLYISKF